MNFFEAKLDYSNLAGVGPDFNSNSPPYDSNPEGIFYSGVGTYLEEPFDLEVTLASGSFEASKHNTDTDYSVHIGLAGQFGQLINAPKGSDGRTTHYSFAFQKDGKPLTLNYFYFSFFDLDRGDGIQEGTAVSY
jgi:hypothetical protein